MLDKEFLIYATEKEMIGFMVGKLFKKSSFFGGHLIKEKLNFLAG